MTTATVDRGVDDSVRDGAMSVAVEQTESRKRGAQLETITTATFNKYSDQIGKKVKSAKDLNLPTPDGFEAWWPPKGYKAPKI